MRTHRPGCASGLRMILPLGLLLGMVLLAWAAPDDKDIDWNRARQLYNRAQRGEELTSEEQAYLERARQVRQKQGGKASGPAPGGKDSVGLTPLPELGQSTYKGESGGLYGEGRNEPPEAHQGAARKETAKIRPLDPQGRPAPEGQIVLVSIGMSNTTQEFSAFKALADRDPQKSPHVVIVDGAQGGQGAEQWTDPKGLNYKRGELVWRTVDMRLKTAGVTPQQVQVLWIKQALPQQGQFGEFPKHARKLESDLIKILQIAKERYANLRIAYLSSRIYAGYATTRLNPEPYAYEGAFAVRWVIQDQIKGDPSLNYDPERGAVKAPLVLWGPYLWSDGSKPRKSDGLVWKREDLAPSDGTHPSESGRKKVAELLLTFLKTDLNAHRWFLKEPNANKK